MPVDNVNRFARTGVGPAGVFVDLGLRSRGDLRALRHRPSGAGEVDVGPSTPPVAV